MKKVVRLTESDLENIVLRVIKSRIDEQMISAGVIDRPDLNRTYSTSKEDFKKFEAVLATRAKDKSEVIQRYESQGYKKDESFTPLALQLYALSSSVMSLKRNPETKIMSLEPGESYKKYESSLKKLESMMDEVSLKVWETTKEVNPAFYLFIFRKSEDILGLLSSVRKKTRSIIVDNSKTIQDVPKTPEEVEVPSLAFTDTDVNFDNKFATGSPNLKSEYIQGFTQSLSKMMKDTKDLLIKNNTNPAVSFPGRIYISEIIIKSSSSKVPQSKLPAPYTTDPNNPQDTTGFLNLSKDRAESMKKLVEKFISDNSRMVFTDEKTKMEVDFKGKNGDGTSGIPWDKSKGSQDPAYLEAQYANIYIKFTVQPKIDTTPESTPEPIETNGYVLKISGERRGKFYIDFNFTPPNMSIGGFKGFSGGDVLCDAYKG